MRSTDSPDSLIPDKDGFSDRWFRSLVRMLDPETARDSFGGDSQIVDDAEDRLVEHFQTEFKAYLLGPYLKVMGTGIVAGFVVDTFFQPVPMEAYGILSVLIGAFTMGTNTTNGPIMIAIHTSSADELERASMAKQTAQTVAGLVAFLVGFGIQLLAVSTLFGAVVLMGVAALGVIEVIRTRRSEDPVVG